jgi:hypothetical protein
MIYYLYNFSVKFEIAKVRTWVCSHVWEMYMSDRMWVGRSHSSRVESKGFPPRRRSVFGPRPSRVGLLMDKVTLVNVSCYYFELSCQFSAHQLSMIINYPNLYSLDTESVVEQPSRCKEVKSEYKGDDKQGLDGLSLWHYYTNLKDWNWFPM